MSNLPLEPRKDNTSRSVEKVIEIEAPAEAVWKALTEADELTRWFPLHAKTKPGVGGAIWVSWGAPIEGESAIQIWEPHRRLRTTWPFGEGHGALADAVLAVDYLLEARGGTTTLRVVHSGFGYGDSWDEQYDGVRQGWDFQLRGLKHYLEHHRGTPRRVIWSRRTIRGSSTYIWQRLFGPEGLACLPAITTICPGEPLEFTSIDGTRYEGRLDLHVPSKQFCGTVNTLNNGYLLVQVETCGGPAEIWMWMNTYGVPEAMCRIIQDHWDAMLKRLLP